MSLAHWLSGASLWGLKTSVLKRERAGRRTMISCGMDPSAEAQPAGVICSSMSFSARHSPPSWEVYLITWAPFAAATRFFSGASSEADARHVTAVTSVTTATLTVELPSPSPVEPLEPGVVSRFARTQLLQCEPQDVAGLGPRRPRRAIQKIEPQDVAGLGPRRPRRAIQKIEPQDVAGLGQG